MNQFGDVVLAYGQSDEYSFVFRRGAETYNRRARSVQPASKASTTGEVFRTTGACVTVSITRLMTLQRFTESTKSPFHVVAS